MMKLIIDGTFPNLNDYIAAERESRYAGAAMKRRYTELVAYYAMSQLGDYRPGKVIVHYTWYEPSRKRDMDNICAFGRKVIQDGLVMAKVLKNDGWNDIAGFTDSFAVDKQRPRIEIEFEEIG